MVLLLQQSFPAPAKLACPIHRLILLLTGPIPFTWPPFLHLSLQMERLQLLSGITPTELLHNQMVQLPMDTPTTRPTTPKRHRRGTLLSRHQKNQVPRQLIGARSIICFISSERSLVIVVSLPVTALVLNTKDCSNGSWTNITSTNV